MRGGTSIRSQRTNFARESKPASRLVKILLKDYIQNKRAIYKRQEGKNTQTEATLTQTCSKKRNHSATNKGNRGEQQEGRHAHSSKANLQENRSTANEGDRGGEKRGKTHTQEKNSEHKGDRGRHTRNTLRKTEMKRVTNDLTDTAIGSPLALDKTAPAPRPKTFKKQR